VQIDDVALRATRVRARRRRKSVGSDERGIYIVKHVRPDLADACPCIRRIIDIRKKERWRIP